MKDINNTIDNQLKANRKYFTNICIICIFPFLFEIFWLTQIAYSLSDCSYSQGSLVKINLRNKKIDLKIDRNLPSSNLQHSTISLFSNFTFKDDNLFSDISSALQSDSIEHYIQIWFKFYSVPIKGRIGTSSSYDYYQIIIDGRIIKPYDKWEYKKKPILVMILSLIVTILVIKYYNKTKKNLEKDFSEQKVQSNLMNDP